MERLLAWTKAQSMGAEVARVLIDGTRLAATGVTIGAREEPYRLDYRLETADDFVTTRLQIKVEAQDWSRWLDLTRGSDGVWSCEVDQRGNPTLPEPGGDMGLVRDALDCDLALSPLTNTMPVLRHGLLEAGGPVDLLMAWVSVPDLGVFPSEQRYRFLRAEGDRRIVRYEGKHRSFVGDLEFDTDGFVIHYPELAQRLGDLEGGIA
jgi:hypothetical protein